MFTKADLRLFRATAVLASVVAYIGLIILILWIISNVLSVFYSLLLPLAIAAVVALVLEPVVNFFQTRLKISRLIAVIVTSVLLILLITGLFFLVLPEILDQLTQVIQVVPEYFIGFYEHVTESYPALMERIAAKIDDVDVDFLTFDMSNFWEKITRYSGLVTTMAFIPLFLFFMLKDGKAVAEKAPEIISVFGRKKQQEILYLANMFIGYITAFFQGQLVIALIMGVLLAIGFTVIGLQAGIIIGLMMGVFNIVPFLGMIVGLVISLPTAWFQTGGGLQMVGLTILVILLVQFVESWFLTPRIMSEKSGLHPAVVVISLFFWGIVFNGIIGMILAVPITAFLVSSWLHIKNEYLNSVITPDHDDLIV